MSNDRVLVISHAHPDFSAGGAEIAAYNLFKSYKQHDAVDQAWFLARADRGRGVTGYIRKRRDCEYLWEQGISNEHLMKTAHQDSIVLWFRDLLHYLKPTVVHIHHYANIGLEIIRAIKNVDSTIKVFLTLHEYIAVCKHDGKMVKTGDGYELCSSESFDECSNCFPQHTPEDFWLRKHHFQKHFDLIDGFISPSEFLRQRYIQWGIAKERIIVIENGQADSPMQPPRELNKNEIRNRFAFFGQVTPYKV